MYVVWYCFTGLTEIFKKRRQTFDTKEDKIFGQSENVTKIHNFILQYVLVVLNVVPPI